MLRTKRLDDQSYDEILESAMNRLPALCPTWTDYNAHDPGVTMLELFSWYEEMQRYHLDHTTEEIRRRLLALLNEAPRPAEPARCLVDLSAKRGVWPEGTPFHTEEGISFELEETAELGETRLSSVIVRGGRGDIDVTKLLNLEDSVVQPFLYGGEETELLLQFTDVDREHLRLWIRVAEPTACPRNPFADESQMPRSIAWYWNGREISPEKDETHAMSVSGFVILPVSPCEEGTLHLKLTDPGCEEVVRVSEIRVGMYRAVQQQTWRRLFTAAVPCRADAEYDICFAPAVTGFLTLFLRRSDGWAQVTEYQDTVTETGRHLCVDASAAVQDGSPNLMAVCTAQDYLQSAFLDSEGLPNQEIPFSVTDGRPVGEMLLVCDTLDTDGEIRPMVWHRVDDLFLCSPRDRVFLYDEVNENLVFGDGLHGAIVPAGRDAILVASLHISRCSLGNIPGGAVLQTTDEDGFYSCTPGAGGRDRETSEEATVRFLRNFPDTRKCVTAADYARLAAQTPGLRVMMAKAIPGYDPKEPSGHATGSLVSVVVLPYSHTPFATPDKRFLEAVRQQLEKYRPICTQVDVCPPRYFKVNMQLQLRGDGSLNENTIYQWVTEWFSHGEIGGEVNRNDLLMFLQKKPGVWKIERLELEGTSGECGRNSSGNLRIPADGIAVTGKLDLVIKSQYA